MIRVAICDNNIQSLEATYKEILGLFQTKFQYEFLLRRFHSVYDLLECLENPNLSFNIYFLEIDMPIYTGIEVGRMIRQNDEYAVIIYTASNKDSALDAISTNPLHYIIRPIDHKMFHDVLDAAIRRVDLSSTKNMLIKRRDGFANVGLYQIVYVEYRDHTLIFSLNNGKVIASRVIHESFSWVAENILNDPRFIRPHSSFVINMDHVQAMSNKEFEMVNSAVIPISKRVAAEVKQRFLEYMTQKRGAVVL